MSNSSSKGTALITGASRALERVDGEQGWFTSGRPLSDVDFSLCELIEFVQTSRPVTAGR